MARPTPPDAGTEEDLRWRKEQSISWNGGSLTAAYGNIVQTWVMDENSITKDTAIPVDRAAYKAQRRNKYSDDAKEVNVPAKVYNRYPRHNSSLAAAGEVYTIRTDVGEYTARVTGDVQDFIGFVLDNRSSLHGTIWIYSGSNAEYGPFRYDNPLTPGDG